MPIESSRYHLENCPVGGGGGRGMMVKDVTKSHLRHIWGVGAYLNVCVQGCIQEFEFREGGREGGTSKVLC